jgi:molecular chaperone GrpE
MTDDETHGANAVDVTPEEPSLEQRLSEAREQAADWQDKYLRARADMENFRKRIDRQSADALKAARRDLLRKVLGVRDNLERALQYSGDGQVSGEGLVEGVRLTTYQLDQLLESEGVKPIEAEGAVFDPHLAEAIHSVNDPNVPDHTVIQVVRRGYTLNDEVLRPAQVVVSVHNGEE